MLLDLRVLTISSWEGLSNCLVRFSDILWRPKPSLWNEVSGSASGLSELQFMKKKGKDRQRYFNVAIINGKQRHFNSIPFKPMIMVNGLHLYSSFLQLFYQPLKALYNTCHIHPFTHTSMQLKIYFAFIYFTHSYNNTGRWNPHIDIHTSPNLRPNTQTMAIDIQYSHTRSQLV